MLSRPEICAMPVALVTVLAVDYAVTPLTVEGDVAWAINGTSETYLANHELKRNFGAPSKNEVSLVRAGDFGDPEAFRALQNQAIEPQLNEGWRRSRQCGDPAIGQP